VTIGTCASTDVVSTLSSNRVLAQNSSALSAPRCQRIGAEQVERLNNLAPAAGERHEEGNMAVIDR
jgi:hypothetical protein